MSISDERLEQIRAWFCDDLARDPVVRRDELASMANELKQLRLRTLARSRMAAGAMNDRSDH